MKLHIPQSCGAGTKCLRQTGGMISLWWHRASVPLTYRYISMLNTWWLIAVWVDATCVLRSGVLFDIVYKNIEYNFIPTWIDSMCVVRLSNWVIYLLLPSFDGKLSTNKKYEPVNQNNRIITAVSLAACWEPFQGLLAMILPKIGRIRHYYFF